MPQVKINEEWKQVLQTYFDSHEFAELAQFVKSEYQTKRVYPNPENIFKAFDLTPFSQVKVVILGQDPYHGPNQAHGLCFSVPTGVPLPPSLVNIYREIENSLGIKKDFSNGNLEAWAKQGVFLLNTILTVVANQPGSHQNRGWEQFTDYVIQTISREKKHVVFMLWGNFARSKKGLIDQTKHLVLEAAHPSPYSANKGFFGCNHFLLCNQYLKSHQLSEIRW